MEKRRKGERKKGSEGGMKRYKTNNPWPRPDMQGLSSMASSFELLERYQIVPSKSRQGGPALQHFSSPILLEL